MRLLRRRVVHIGGIRTAYLDVGSGEPVVALHGVPTSSALFEPLLPTLQGFRLVAPDLLGQGDTEAPPRGRLGHAEYMAHLEAFLETVAPPTFHLVVHDFGGMLGLEWAAAYPHRLRSLVVLSTSVSPTFRWSLVSRVFWTFELLGGSRYVQGLLLRTARRPGAMDPRLAERWSRPWTRRRFFRGRDLFASRHLRGLSSRLGRIHAPTLVLWGRRDDVFPPRYGRRIRKRIRGAEMKIIPRAGHLLPLDSPGATGAEIAAFLRRAGTSAGTGEKLIRRFGPPAAS